MHKKSKFYVLTDDMFQLCQTKKKLPTDGGDSQRFNRM